MIEHIALVITKLLVHVSVFVANDCASAVSGHSKLCVQKINKNKDRKKTLYL